MMAMRKQPRLQRLVAYATIFPKLRPLSSDILDPKPELLSIVFCIVVAVVWVIPADTAVAVVMSPGSSRAVTSGIAVWPRGEPITPKSNEPTFMPSLGPASRIFVAEGAYCVKFATDFSCVVAHHAGSETAVALSKGAVPWLEFIVIA